MCNLMHMFSLSLSHPLSFSFSASMYIQLSLSLSLFLPLPLLPRAYIEPTRMTDRQTDTYTPRYNEKKKNICLSFFHHLRYIYISILIGTVYVYVIYVLMYLYTYPPCMPNTVQAGCQGCSGQAPTSRWDAGVMAV